MKIMRAQVHLIVDLLLNEVLVRGSYSETKYLILANTADHTV